MAETRPDGAKRSAGVLETVMAVAASFFGVRGGRAHDRDAQRLNPIAVIVTGVALGVAFVLTLLWIVRMVVR